MRTLFSLTLLLTASQFDRVVAIVGGGEPFGRGGKGGFAGPFAVSTALQIVAFDLVVERALADAQ